MKKNTYDERDSEIRALYERSHEISKAQRNNCWVELEQPEKHGWYVVAALRKDIANRADADTIEEVLSLVGGKCWTKQKKTGFRIPRHICTITGKKDWQEFMPWAGDHWHNQKYGIQYEHWVTLRPEVRRWFTTPSVLDYWGRGWCSCDIPSWFWEVKFERCWATHYQEVDTKLQQEDAWIENTLESKKYHDAKERVFGWRHYPKRNPYTGKQRANDKQVLRKMKAFGWDDSVAEFNNKVDDKWDWC